MSKAKNEMKKQDYQDIYKEFIHNVTDDFLINHLVELRQTIDALTEENKFLKQSAVLHDLVKKRWFDI